MEAMRSSRRVLSAAMTATLVAFLTSGVFAGAQAPAGSIQTPPTQPTGTSQPSANPSTNQA